MSQYLQTYRKIFYLLDLEVPELSSTCYIFPLLIKIFQKSFYTVVALAGNSSACMQEGMKGTGLLVTSSFVGSQYIFRFDFQLRILNNSYFMLTCCFFLLQRVIPLFIPPPQGRVNPRGSHVAIFRENPKVASFCDSKEVRI